MNSLLRPLLGIALAMLAATGCVTGQTSAPTKVLLILDTTMKANWKAVVAVGVGLPLAFLAVRNRPAVRWRPR